MIYERSDVTGSEIPSGPTLVGPGLAVSHLASRNIASDTSTFWEERPHLRHFNEKPTIRPSFSVSGLALKIPG